MAKLDTLYLDQYLVAVNKPAGMLVHPGKDPEPKENIAMKIIRDQLGQKVYTVHRLDRPTSGILFFALDQQTEKITCMLFENKEVEKVYYAVVPGETQKAWVCEEPLQKSSQEKPQPSKTSFRQIKYLPAGTFNQLPELDISIVEARPLTGRYHQIRKHLLHAGHPIIGDYRYGDKDINSAVSEKLGIPRMMLMAKEIEFHNPIIGKDIEINLPFDPEFDFYLKAKSK